MNQLSVGNIVHVGDMEFHSIEGGFGKDKKAMLVKEIAEIHGRELFKVNQLINDNRKRFIDGQDIMDIRANTFEVLGQKLGFTKQSFNQSKNVYILSERGYAKLLKIMDDDLAWEKYDQLVDGYFQMRKTVREGIESPASRQRLISSVNHEADNLRKVFEAAGIDPKFTAIHVAELYRTEAGQNIPVLPIESEKTYDRTEIAQELGIYSKSGKPHSSAIGAILKNLDVSDNMVIHSSFSRNGHDSDYDRYKAPVLDMVSAWFKLHGKTSPIALDKSYNVIYR
jgi:hypothetical protein